MKGLLLYPQVTGYLLVVLASLGQLKPDSLCRLSVFCKGHAWGKEGVM